MRNWVSQRSPRLHPNPPPQNGGGDGRALPLIAGVVVLFVCSIASAQVRTHVIVTFKQSAVVANEQIHLRDVADVSGVEDELRSRLEALPVASLPPDGLRRVVRRDSAMHAIKSAESSLTIDARGATQVFVSLRTQRVAAERLHGIAREHLEAHLRAVAPSVSRLVVEPVGALGDLQVAGGEIDIEPRALKNTRPAKRICVWLDVRRDGKAYRSIPVWMSVQAYAPVLTTTRAFEPRENIPPSAVARAERDIAAVRGDWLSGDDEIAGRRTRFHVPAGAVLRRRDVELSPVVLTDQEVDVRVAVGAVVIQTKAVAEEEGHVGEYIRVRNPSSASIFMARVVGDKAVLVTER